MQKRQKKLLFILILISGSLEAAKLNKSNKKIISKAVIAKKKNNKNITFIKTPFLNFVLRRFPSGTTVAQQYRPPVPSPVLRRFGNGGD